MDAPKPGSWGKPKRKKPFVRYPHLTQEAFKNDEALLELKKKITTFNKKKKEK